MMGGDPMMNRSDEQLRILLEASPIPLIISRVSDGKILYANKHLGELVGLTPDELIGRETPDFYADPDDRKYVLERLAEDGCLQDHEVRIKDKDGRGLWTIFSLVISELNGEPVIIGGLYDITERKRAEGALRESETLFRQLTESIDEVFWIRDIKTERIIYVSQAYERIFGRSRQSLYDHPESLLHAVHPDDRGWVHERMSASIGHPDTEMQKGEFRIVGPDGSQEFRIIRPDGSMRWLRTRAFPIRDQSGEIYRICGVSEDFTEHRQADAALESERNFVSTVLDTAGALVVVLDPQGRIVRFNRACEITTGYTFDEVRGKPFWDLFLIPEEVERVQALFEELRAGYFPNEGENYWVTKEGDRRLISWSNTALLDSEGSVEYIIGTGIDMTERKHAEEALAESEERFRNIVENANDIIYSLTPDGIFSYVAPNWTDILGYDVSEAEGKSFAPFIHPEDLQTCLGFLQKVVETGKKQSGVEYRVKHKDGSWRWHTSNASCLKDEEGNVISFIGIARDITDKKAASEELEKANQELRETQSQLVQSEKMASLGNLVAGIAHEINTPVGAINSMQDTLMRAVEKLKDTLASTFSEEYNENRAMQASLKVILDANRVIATGTERVTGIVRSLRRFARLDEAELKEVDIHEAIDNTLTLVHHDLKNRIEVVKEYGDIPPIVCYPSRLNQVFLNLLVNASHAIEGEGEIRIRTFLQDDRVRVSIQDSGVGIPQENLDKVFDPGFTTKGVGVGTGLGLSICYQIVQDHRGKIQVKSEVGKGTTFTVILPTDLSEEDLSS